MEAPTQVRSCGGCTACCFTHSITTLNKPVATHCKECDVGVGCKIYGRHPFDCAMYKCFWLMTDAPEHWRPDRMGVVIDLWPGRAPLVRIWEVVPGAMEKPEVHILIEGFKSNKRPIILRRLNPAGGYVNDLVVSLEEDSAESRSFFETLDADLRDFSESCA